MSYTILGRAIKSEYLAVGTLLSTVGLSMIAASGGSKDAAPRSLKEVKESVKVDASSKDEEDFIKAFLKEAEKEGGSGH